MKTFLQTLKFSTPIGSVVAIGTDKALWFLNFDDEKKTEERLQLLLKKSDAELIKGESKILFQTKVELDAYFEGSLKIFKIPLYFVGTDFQRSSWNQLLNVPYGKTQSYKEQANALHHPKAFRAVALANGANPIPIIVPCHRIIASNGSLGGYSAGIERKEWLLKHERNFF